MHICNQGHNKWVGLIGVGGDLGYRGYRASPKLVENTEKEPRGTLLSRGFRGVRRCHLLLTETMVASANAYSSVKPC